MARNEHSGHPMKWFKDQNSARSFFECPICLEVLKDPVQVRDCGHQFCELCMDDILKTDARCPSCRIALSQTVVFKDYAANRLIRKLDVNCCNQRCSWTGSLSSYLEEHMNWCSSLARGSSLNNNVNVEEIQQRFESLVTEISILKLQNENIKGEMKELKTKHESEVKQLKSKHQEDITKLKEEITELRAMSLCSGTFTMKISDFNGRLARAKSSRCSGTILSDPFYSSHDGYKLRLQVNINEAHRGYSGYLGVYIQLMKSDHDALLTWPFDKEFTFTLIDQQNNEYFKENYLETLSPDNVEAFKRPRENQNVGYGIPQFILHSKLRSRKYIKENTIYIRVVVEP